MVSQLLDSRDISNILGVAPSTISNWARKGRLPFQTLRLSRNVIRFRRADVEAYLLARTVPAAPQNN